MMLPAIKPCSVCFMTHIISPKLGTRRAAAPWAPLALTLVFDILIAASRQRCNQRTELLMAVDARREGPLGAVSHECVEERVFTAAANIVLPGTKNASSPAACSGRIPRDPTDLRTGRTLGLRNCFVIQVGVGQKCPKQARQGLHSDQKQSRHAPAPQAETKRQRQI